MAETVFRGPVVSLGGLMDGVTGPFDGPDINYQGNAFPNSRFTPGAKDGLVPARVPCFAPMQSVVVTDTVVAKSNLTTIVGASSATAGAPGTLMPLVATTITAVVIGSQTYATGVPIIPLGTTSVVTVAAIDFGFTTGTTVAASSTVVVLDSSLFAAGQFIVIGGAANTGFTGALITQVTTVPNATTINISPVSGASMGSAPIGAGNAQGASLVPLATQFGPSTYSANAATPYIPGGLGLVFDARQASCRTLQLAANTGVIGTSGFTITGYDVYGALMTETMTATGTTLAFGKKAFKYISSITSLGTGAATFTFGISDVFGVNLRAETWEVAAEVAYNNTWATTANGFTSALALSAGPSTGSTGDVRGTWQISTAGALSTSILAPLSNGTSRLYIVATPRVNNLLKTGPGTFTSSLYGVAQA